MLNLIRVFRLQEGDQHALFGVIDQPFADAFDALIIFCAQFFEIKTLEMIPGF